jgi:glutathione S-transferase
MHYVSFAIVLALLEYFFFVVIVAAARDKYPINASATTGDLNFESIFRIQQNSLEQLVIFIPAIYLFGLYVHATTIAVIGLLFLIGRAIYYKAYITDPPTRTMGMVCGVASYAILLLGALIVIILEII